VHLKVGRSKSFRNYLDTDESRKLVGFLSSLVPKVCYFPTFLFGLPDQIYLSNPPEGHDNQLNTYYVQIIQDILDSLGENLDIQKHIVQRVERTIQPGAHWDLYAFLKSDEKQQIEHVMMQIAGQITKVVFSRWNDIFGVKLRNKAIDIEWEAEPNPREPTKPSIHLKFWIRDTSTRYKLSERSMGFRWFFCFLLFTQFRASRKKSSAIFLFDEPASNLHSRAQAQLLESFPNIATGNNMIVYSTHSHYMIEPRWLEGAFIVYNDAVDYERDFATEANDEPRNTNIHVKRYRDFVGQHPDRFTYFQPILDRLDYAPSKLDFAENAIFVEGKIDFYILEYFRRLTPSAKQLRFMPSSGANDIGPLVSLYLGWGKKFVIVLDDDKAGRDARDRYRAEWVLSDTSAVTLGDISATLKNKTIEGILSKDGTNIIRSNIGKDRLSKKDIAHFFQEQHSLNRTLSFDVETLRTANLIFDALKNHLKL
jgi:hypothetical protein